MTSAAHPASDAARRGAARAIALVQFFFVCTWTVYAIYLPRLLADMGLPPQWAPRVLLLDQLVFLGADIACGVAADRVQRTLGRLGTMVAGLTLLSCLAFLLLPHAVRLGGAAVVLFGALTLVWTITSSALRAPPWVMLSRHAARPALPALNALTLVGLAAGGAAAPYLAVLLRGVDPRLPFALASIALAAATLAIATAERRLGAAPPAPAAPAATPQVGQGVHFAWLAALALLAAGFQTHVSINSAGQFQRVAPGVGLEWLLPVFWIGFALAMPAGGALVRRFGALPLTTFAAAPGALAVFVAAQTGTLTVLLAAQCVAGAAWGLMLLAAFSVASDLGRSGREGLALGSLFAVLALATLARIAAVLAGWPQQLAGSALAGVLPAAGWIVAGALASIGLKLRRPSARRSCRRPARR
jgi:MFS family permease